MSNNDSLPIYLRIEKIERRLAELDEERLRLQSRLADLKNLSNETAKTNILPSNDTEGPRLTVNEKLAVFRRLFQGRPDVYARRWEDTKTGKSGYSPACRYEWPPGAKNRADAVRILLPLTDEVITQHLNGECTIGFYPLLRDDTCWLLAVDFDKDTWQEDALAFVETCKSYRIPTALERSRSGNGGHVWIFFREQIAASTARKLGSFMLTRTMDRRPEIGLGSYDRLFPNQDTLPSGGFGNLIALPLQKQSRLAGNAVFIDEHVQPYKDQMAFLSSVQLMSKLSVEEIVEAGQRQGQIIGVRMVATDENDDTPWTSSPSRRRPAFKISGPLPQSIQIVLANQIFIPKSDLPPQLINQLIRIAAFQNPEYYKAQAMRFSTYDKPRIISCAENFTKHLALPRGCLDEVRSLFESIGIGVELDDQRSLGSQISTLFLGKLFPEQQVAADSLLKHDCGVLAATTAFGKTVVASYLISERKANTLILVNSRQLMDQWKERLTAFLDLKKVGTIGGGKRTVTGIVDVATVQSLYRKGVVDDLVANYGHIVVDECHHLSALSVEQVVRASKAKFFTGLSATVVRKDGKHPIIFMQCGPVRFRNDAKREASKRAFDHQVIVRTTEFVVRDLPNDSELINLQCIYNSLVQDTARNFMITHDVLEAISEGRSPIILTERISHLELLVELLQPVVKNLIVLRGGMGIRHRRSVLDQLASLKDTDQRLLIGTGRYIGEGFDDPRLDTLFLTMPISWKGTLAQYAGRLHRSHIDKTAVRIYDYADLREPLLVKMHERRLAGYRSLGYEIASLSGHSSVVDLTTF